MTFERNRRSPLQRFCCHVCRRALERVLDRERRWRTRGAAAGLGSKAGGQKAGERRRGGCESACNVWIYCSRMKARVEFRFPQGGKGDRDSSLGCSGFSSSKLEGREQDVLHWAEEQPGELTLEEVGESYARYRLHVPEDERGMMRSLERYGQISPIVVCLEEGRYELIDGFKRLGAAGVGRQSMRRLSARRINTDERGAKAAIYGLNRAGGRTREIEEAWIVHALVREDGLAQVEVAELLGRHKSLGLPAALS